LVVVQRRWCRVAIIFFHERMEEEEAVVGVKEFYSGARM